MLSMDNAAEFEPITTLGDSVTLEECHTSTAMKFVRSLHCNSKCNSLSALRSEKADEGMAAKKFPPTEDSFTLHLFTSMYQLYIWKFVHVSKVDVSLASQFGYEKEEDGSLPPKIMTENVASLELWNLVCDYSGDSCISNCLYYGLNQPCTTACACEVPLKEEENSCLNALTMESLKVYTQYKDTD